MKERLLKLLKAKQQQRSALMTSLVTSDTKEERSAINDTIAALDTEIGEVEQMISACDERAESNSGSEEEQHTDERGMNVLSSMQSRSNQRTANSDPYDTEDYRTAFMEFCRRGTPIPANLIPEKRADAWTTTTDASAVIPTTILNEIIKEIKSYGSLYAAVRKFNVQGGVSIPILSLKPSATWITADTGTSESDKQKIQANTAITFNYYGLECKVAQTLLANVTTLDMFQQLFIPLATEAMAKALDIAIMNGTGTGQPTGITVDTRVPNANKITLTPSEFASWADWKKKVIAKIPKSYQNGKFYFAQSTFDGYIDGMVDSNGQPIARVNYGIADGVTYRFAGKLVETVETDVIKDYDSASTGDVIGVYFNSTDYAINSNLEMQTVKWVDNNTNEILNKCILICDGKLVDPNGVILIKKGAAPTP